MLVLQCVGVSKAPTDIYIPYTSLWVVRRRYCEVKNKIHVMCRVLVFLVKCSNLGRKSQALVGTQWLAYSKRWNRRAMPSNDNPMLSSLTSTQCLERMMLNGLEYKIPWGGWLAPLLDTQRLQVNYARVRNEKTRLP